MRKRLREEYGVEVGSVFTREIELLIVKWMISQHKTSVEEVASHLFFTYFFIHNTYKMDRKGSCLTPFMQEV